MKKILLFCSALILCLGFTSVAQPTQTEDGSAPADSVVNVIAWFAKNDTAVYKLNNVSWKITPGDSTVEYAISSKFMITVKDSTDAGYKMEMKYLEMSNDSLPDNVLGRIQKTLLDKYAKKICNTPIKFETDKFGAITEITNLKEIKKQINSIMKDMIKQLESSPEMKEAKNLGINTKALIDNFDSDQLVDQSLEELNMLFTYYGYSFPIGDKAVHSDATDTEYETMTYISVLTNDEGHYRIAVDEIPEIPESYIKEIATQNVMNLVSSMPPEIQEEAKQSIENITDYKVSVSNYFQVDYYPDGWPGLAFKQDSSVMLDRGTVKQTTVELVDFK